MPVSYGFQNGSWHKAVIPQCASKVSWTAADMLSGMRPALAVGPIATKSLKRNKDSRVKRLLLKRSVAVIALMQCANWTMAYDMQQAMSLDRRTVLHLETVESVRGERVAELTDGAIVSSIRVACEASQLRIERTGIDRSDGSYEVSNGMPGNYFQPAPTDVLGIALRKICSLKLEDE